MKYILLHGLGQTSASWEGVAKAIGGEFELLCPDLSEWLCGKEMCYRSLYQALETYCDGFDEPLYLCGLSLGGILALQYALEHPKKVNSLALIGAQYTMPKRLLQVQNLIFRFMPDRAFQKMGFGKMDLIALSKSMMELDFQADLGKIRCRTLVLCGEKDKANRAAALKMRDQIPDAEFVSIERAGHEVNQDNSVGLARALRAFYKEI